MNTAIWIVVLVVVGVMLYSRFGGTITLPGLPKMDFRLAGFGGAALAAFYVLYRVHGLASQEVPGYEQTVGKGAGYLLEDPILALSLLFLFGFVVWKWRSQNSGQTGAGAAGSRSEEILPDGVPIRANKTPSARHAPRRGVMVLVGVLAAFTAAVLLAWASPSEWRPMHGEAYIPVQGLLWSGAFIVGWMFAVKDESGTMSFWMLFVTAVVFLVLPILNFHSVDVLFSPVQEKFPELAYIKEFPVEIQWIGKGIRFWHIWAGTAFLATMAALLGKPSGNSAWGFFVFLLPVLFLWNQIFPR